MNQHDRQLVEAHNTLTDVIAGGPESVDPKTLRFAARNLLVVAARIEASVPPPEPKQSA